MILQYVEIDLIYSRWYFFP